MVDCLLQVLIKYLDIFVCSFMFALNVVACECESLWGPNWIFNQISTATKTQTTVVLFILLYRVKYVLCMCLLVYIVYILSFFKN